MSMRCWRAWKRRRVSRSSPIRQIRRGQLFRLRTSSACTRFAAARGVGAGCGLRGVCGGGCRIRGWAAARAHAERCAAHVLEITQLGGAACRLGICGGADHRCAQSHSPAVQHLPLADEAAAVAALNDDAFVKRSLALVREGRPRLEACSNRGLRTLPSAANFVTALAPSAAAAQSLSKNRGARHPGARQKYDMPNAIRVTIGDDRQMETLERALSAMTRRFSYATTASCAGLLFD